MKYWQAIKHVCEHPEDKAIAVGWCMGIDGDGDLTHRHTGDYPVRAYIPPGVRDADWQIEHAWTECSQEAALDRLQEGGYLVETRADCEWERVRLDGCVVRVGLCSLEIMTDRKWRYRKVTA